MQKKKHMFRVREVRTGGIFDKTMAIFVLADAKRNLELFVSQISRIRSLIFKRKYLMEDFNYAF